MKHIESAYQTQVVEWSRWAFKANPALSVSKINKLIHSDFFHPVEYNFK